MIGASRIAVFQHAGAETASWYDGKVQKRENHPIVYPAAGSHATFFSDAVYVENGQAVEYGTVLFKVDPA